MSNEITSAMITMTGSSRRKDLCCLRARRCLRPRRTPRERLLVARRPVGVLGGRRRADLRGGR